MPSTDLVHKAPSSHVRSFHRAFSGELTIYHLGNDVSLWRPIPARGVFWAAALEIIILIFTKAVGLRFPLFSIVWGFTYLFVPIGLAWLLTVAKIEGRRIHVTLGAWARCFIGSQRTVGGVRRLRKEEALSPTQIRVQDSCDHVPLRPVVRYAVAALPVVCLLAVLLIVVTNHRSSSSSVRRAAVAALAPVSTAPHSLATYLFVFPKIAPRRPMPVHARHRAVRRHAARFRTVPRKRAAVPPRHVVTVRRHRAPPPPPALITRPKIIIAPVHVAPRRIAVLRPRSNPSPACYPGELGC